MHEIAFLIKVSAPLAEQYYQLYTTVKAVEHRSNEMESYLKKRSSLLCSLERSRT